ncbi:MAG: DoxX family protein [Pyrinomonadaceae bacterium]
MEAFLGRYAAYIYAVMRIVTGFVFLWHGSQKLFGYPPMQMPPGMPTPEFTPLMAVSGSIELVGGLLIMIGLFTSFAAFIASGTMAVAYWFFHFRSDAVLPLQNGGEPAVIYCFLFLYIASRGSGLWSVESMFKGSRSGDGT